ncbi:hypothetical protein GCM10008018_64720 [Paenibacillus marchantiophytorum]|uniref:Uncharacterized protein n=1 Tax=Paenibacillus marchantiophytorum TaxID=1619310 RepID=A0ABQ1FF50_9BACL|nr:hypothetical protein [Paenibacillus marchantiophytorum]GGA10331.1 hypothetical protein GCM10008018_64720 [Paenibacillus marchantiophytorum]
MIKPSCNPFDDTSIHATTQQSQDDAQSQRVPFNDVIHHNDVVQGMQAPKRVEQMPKWYQQHRRNSAALSVLIFGGFLVYNVIQIIQDIVSGR